MSEPKEELKTINLDVCPYGDMKIALTSTTIDVTYRVSSHQLCLGSSVFRGMLGPESCFSEANELRRHQSISSTARDSNGSLFQIAANEEHDPTALATVLYVLHGRAEYIPESITFENLLDIAIICDYYDCAASMRPWDEIWMNPLRSLTSEPGYQSWLFIAWVFGDEGTFGQMTESCSRRGVMVDGEFGIIVDGKAQRLDCHLPQGIIDAIAEQRVKIGEEIVRTCRDIFTKYEDENSIKCEHGVKACDYIIFAGLYKSFKSMNLFNAGAGFQADLELEAIIQIIKTVMDDGVAGNLRTLQINGFNHSFCYTTVSVEQRLQFVLQDIKPLCLTAFSKKPGTRYVWESFLDADDALCHPVRMPYGSARRLNVCTYGDMEIILKSNTTHVIFVVSSHQLRTGFPIFRNLLGQDSPFEEHARHTHKQINDSGLNEDDPNQTTRYQHEICKDYNPIAFCIVLYLLHARVQNLPETIYFENLISLLEICDHYECSEFLQPWHEKWVDCWRQFSDNTFYEHWLFAAWVIGDDHIFQALTKKFSQCGIVVDNEFTILVSEGPEHCELYQPKLIPRVIIDAMMEQRNAAAENITQACRRIYEIYSNDTTRKCSINRGQFPSRMCDHFILGELHLGFKAARILCADLFSCRPETTLKRIVEDIKNLTTATLSILTGSKIGIYSHHRCAGEITALASTAQAALDDIKSLQLAAFGRKQAEKGMVSWASVLSRTEDVAE